MLGVHTYSVSEVTQYVKSLVDNDTELASIMVVGEISNFTAHTSGHMYFTLKDSNSRLKCVMFRFQNRKLRFMPRNGIKVLLQGRLSVYERSGEYQLYAENMQPDGIGSLHLAFTELKSRLAEEGLFREERKRNLPLLPGKIAVVTSPTGAAIRDIITTIYRRFERAHIIVAPVLVQGEQAAESIANALALLNQMDDIDVIIIGRGGGSVEELWAFNEEIVARAIVGSRIPVVSAVGHETDYTISDFVADVRVPTPTAAGQFVVPSLAELRDTLETLEYRLSECCGRLIREKTNVLREETSRLQQLTPQRLIEQKCQEVDACRSRLDFAIDSHFLSIDSCFGNLCSSLEALSPLRVLKRGYAILQKEKASGCIVKLEQVEKGNRFEAILYNGRIVGEVVDFVLEE